jgi:ABC-type sugar transport system ATPase subunit
MSSAPDQPLVEMHRISKSFPGVQALDEVSLSVRPGEVHGLVGKNGAGKSTLMHILMGLYPPDAGDIRIARVSLGRLTTGRAKSAGIAHVAQHAKFVPSLSIAENLFSGALPRRAGGFIDWRKMYADAAQRLAQFGLHFDVRRPMGETSVAERQMIEIARALFANAKLVVLDEPTAPLPKHDVKMLFDFIRRQRERGAAFIYISHYLEEIFEVADTVTVLRNGRVVGSTLVSEITQPELIRAISGTAVERFRRAAGQPGKPVLTIRNLTRPDAYFDVDLTVRAGEVVGLTGLEGSGAGALARGLFGLEGIGHGEIDLLGNRYTAQSPRSALRAGLAYLPKDRHGHGIIGIRSVRDNVTLSILGKLQRSLGLIDGRRERALVAAYISALGIKTPGMHAPVETLSGGNQQKVVVAKLVATEPRLLVLHEPTQGVDIQAKVEILRIVDDLSRRGVAIVIASDELSELIDMCDRIVVFYRGRIVREIHKASGQMTSQNLLEAIEGGEARSGAIHG